MIWTRRRRWTTGALAAAFAGAAGACALVAGAALVPAASVAYAAAPDSKGVDEAFTISDERITEPSGLALSTKFRSLFYTHNDSGDLPRVFALDGHGTVVSTLTLGQATNVDWEAIASGPDGRIWVGDIGDNQRARSSITLYRFREPDSFGDRRVQWSRFRLSYPDGPHDAEALLVHPQTGRVYVVTKDPRGGGIYAGPQQLASGVVNRLTRIADAPAMVTDGSFVPDGSAIVLRTYADAHVLSWPDAAEVRSFPLPSQRQGEGLTVSLNGERIFVGSEGAGSTVLSLPITGAGGVVTPTPSSSASASPRSTPATTPPAAPRDTENADSGGTSTLFGGLPLWIPGLVLAVALLAGIVAFLPSRRRQGNPRRSSHARRGAADDGSGPARAAAYERDDTGSYPPLAWPAGDAQASPESPWPGQAGTPWPEDPTPSGPSRHRPPDPATVSSHRADAYGATDLYDDAGHRGPSDAAAGPRDLRREPERFGQAEPYDERAPYGQAEGYERGERHDSEPRSYDQGPAGAPQWSDDPRRSAPPEPSRPGWRTPGPGWETPAGDWTGAGGPAAGGPAGGPPPARPVAGWESPGAAAPSDQPWTQSESYPWGRGPRRRSESREEPPPPPQMLTWDASGRPIPPPWPGEAGQPDQSRSDRPAERPGSSRRRLFFDDDDDEPLA
ncbi:hypothetical protein [Actinopolymorpha alba]|uniref:hypothetical protein n=1 Tax=Actinopolymorpha alba TaxID=533267 RepID=UPI00036F8A09|nr:hypothetical protein [Actinopolymorpha alba]